ncbi:hypothetical protein M413DRAFT_438678 [Hebeloma cylindrosporum]|uniref:Uncharacterized protein n=1 Tax=Hebeloma cylindrosporum TaxID=76867 RepID=A0A0C3D034_HEBCY|nr:hypothetical protein M413DRAFT_438678 [Hebeloma cylindrosporum h7]
MMEVLILSRNGRDLNGRAEVARQASLYIVLSYVGEEDIEWKLRSLQSAQHNVL